MAGRPGCGSWGRRSCGEPGWCPEPPHDNQRRDHSGRLYLALQVPPPQGYHPPGWGPSWRRAARAAPPTRALHWKAPGGSGRRSGVPIQPGEGTTTGASTSPSWSASPWRHSRHPARALRGVHRAGTAAGSLRREIGRCGRCHDVATSRADRRSRQQTVVDNGQGIRANKTGRIAERRVMSGGCPSGPVGVRFPAPPPQPQPEMAAVFI
jgi:hypothetical protein